MRLWSLHPSYLDQKGLGAVWREGLLAQSCLIKGEYTDCKVCEGSGHITYYDSINGVSFPYITKACYTCHGSGKRKTPYYNHPQLERFKAMPDRFMCLSVYLLGIYFEANKRGYKFNLKRINRYDSAQILYNAEHLKIKVSLDQNLYEFKHLLKKLTSRDKQQGAKNLLDIMPDGHDIRFSIPIISENIKPHPLFKVVDGEIESWEKI